MAGDWIKMRGNLWDDPRVAAIVDATDSSEAAVVGGLYWLWAAADQHTEDGFMPGLSLRQIDRKTGVAGLGAAIVAVGWITEEQGGIRISRFDEHNGSSAKRRCSEAKRKGAVRKVSASDADKVRTDCGSDAELEKEKEKDIKAPEPKGSGATAPVDQPPAPVVDPVWHTGLAFLMRKGLPQKQARAFLGKFKQAVGDIAAAGLLARAETEDITDPVPWLSAHATAKGASHATPVRLSAAERVRAHAIEGELADQRAGTGANGHAHLVGSHG